MPGRRAYWPRCGGPDGGCRATSPWAASTTPPPRWPPAPLTTIRRPWERITAEMVWVLPARIGGKEPSGVLLPTELVVRESA